MDKTGYIEITVKGAKGNMPLSPENYDIKEIIEILKSGENLLYPGDKKGRPLISYKMEAGSVKHVLKTSLQYVIGLNAVLGQIALSNNIDFLELPSADALEDIRVMAAKHNYEFIIQTSLPASNHLKIDSNTIFIRNKTLWADAEFYFYGSLVNAGGKREANIHLNTEEYGVLIIQIPKTFLEGYEENLLYKTFGVRVKGKQHIETGEVDKNNLEFLELINYHPIINEDYLDGLIKKATSRWSAIGDKDKWLNDTRGGYNA